MSRARIIVPRDQDQALTTDVACHGNGLRGVSVSWDAFHQAGRNPRLHGGFLSALGAEGAHTLASSEPL
jgi:beta-galactosidase/beta-glucuronidase